MTTSPKLTTLAGDSLHEGISSALTSLGEEELGDDEKLRVLEEVYELFRNQQYEYEQKIDFESEDDSIKDYLLARKVLLDSLDKTKVMGELLLQMLAGNPQNILLMDSLQENIKLSQSSAKSLIDLHNNFTRNNKGMLSNKKLKRDVNEETDGKIEEKVEEVMKKAGLVFR